MPTRPSIWLLVTALMWHGAAGAAEKADTHFAKGTDLRIEGKTKEAVEALKKAVSLMPGNADALVQLGAALEDVSKWEEAAHAYRRALELDPSNRAAQRNLEHIEASRALNEPPKLVNTAREALLQRGLHALEQGDADRALAVFRLCRGLLQNDPRPLFYSAVVMERHGKISDCIALYEQTIAAHPRFAPAWTNLLVVLLASGDREAAKKRAQDAIRALPDDRS
ncbi:MAG: tetratricopeptide repeat protein, partial [Deltaproteobacteria bacterium]|nr:tetratricopeptide repeat protein [Deltaproteobacteria bacterium]